VQEPRRFDVVCSMEVVEHVDNPAAFLRSCAELVKVRVLYTSLIECELPHWCHSPADICSLSTIARTPLSYLLTIVAAEKLLRLVEPGTHTFSKYINPDELVGFFEKPLAPGARPWISRTYAHGLPYAHRSRGARYRLCTLARGLGVGAARDDALVVAGKLFVLGAQTRTMHRGLHVIEHGICLRGGYQMSVILFMKE
jgi:hypothetical protein